MSTPLGQTPAITQADVISEEKRQIDHQRREQGLREIDHDAQSGLVGVSLSGGGVRSGAVSLGFLMGLAQFGILRWVDYLSTVSGGGYAGATLSAELKAQEPRPAVNSNQSPSNSDSRIFSSATADTNPSGKSALNRLRELIFQCNYLFRQHGWMSRAFLGVTVMGTVILSTTVFVTSFVAWLFRCLYQPPVLEFLKAMGFEGDLVVPMTPAIATFFIWFLCWMISFFRHNRHATGNTASVVFSTFLLFTVLGITMIAVTGDIDVEHLRRKTGTTLEFWQEWGTLGMWIKSGILAIIGASLLPYFRPAALLRSGRERTAGPKKILFVLARNGLLFGIPLLFFAYFAHEDISSWNFHRDYRLELKDLLAAENGYEHGPHLKLFSEFEIANSEHTAKPWPAAEVRIRRAIAQYLWTDAIQQEWAYYNLCSRKYALLSAGQTNPAETQQNAILNNDNEVSRLKRLLHLVEFFCERIASGSNDSDLSQMLYWLHESRNSSRRLMYMFNARLLNPCFYKKIPLPNTQVSGLRFWEKPSADSDYIARVKQVLASVNAFYNLPTHPDLQFPSDESTPVQTNLAATTPFRNHLYSIYQARVREIEDFSTVPTAARTTDERFKDVHAKPASMQDLFHFSGAPPKELSEGDLESFRSTVLRLNHQLLRAAFPDTLRPRDSSSEVFSAVVLPNDQRVRWNIVVTSFFIALISSALCDLNAFSWHGFYARQLGEFWVRAGYPKHTRLTLESLSAARPIHLINSSVCLPGKTTTTEGTSREKTADFLLSRLHCGSSLPGVGFVRTENSAFAELQLADAIALSGAALSPWATSNLLVKVLLLIMNLRTGLWLPHPSEAANAGQDAATKGKLFNALRNFFPPLKWVALHLLPIQLWPPRFRTAESWPRLLITDGGHFENLGLESLLKRRCKLIIAVDASEDSNFEFEGLAIVMNRVRTRDGIRFLNPDSNQPAEFPTSLTPDQKSGLSKKRFEAFTIVYPNSTDANRTAASPPAPSTGLLIFVKSVLLKTDPLELQQHKKEFPAFPNDPTSDQAFSPEKFEAYRFLGFTAASQLALKLGINPHDPPKSLIACANVHFARNPGRLSRRRILAALEILHNDLQEGLDPQSPPTLQEALVKDARDILVELRNLNTIPAEITSKLIISTNRLREHLDAAKRSSAFTDLASDIDHLIQLLIQQPPIPASPKHDAKPRKRVKGH